MKNNKIEAYGNLSLYEIPGHIVKHLPQYDSKVILILGENKISFLNKMLFQYIRYVVLYIFLYFCFYDDFHII